MMLLTWLTVIGPLSVLHVHAYYKAPMLIRRDSTEKTSTTTHFLNSTTGSTLATSSSLGVPSSQLELSSSTALSSYTTSVANFIDGSSYSLSDELASRNPSDNRAMPTTSLALQSLTTSSDLPSSSTLGSIAVGDGSGSSGGGGEGKPPLVPPILPPVVPHVVPPGPGGAEGGNGDDAPTDQPSDGPSKSVPSTPGSIMSSSSTIPTFSSTTSGSATISSTSTSSASVCGIATLNPDFPFAWGDDGPLLGSMTLSQSTTVIVTDGSARLDSSSASTLGLAASSAAAETAATTTSLTTSASAPQAPPPSPSSPSPSVPSSAPPAPSQTSSNNKGSSLCKNLEKGEINPCRTAYHLYNASCLYRQYTSYTVTDEGTLINEILPASNGCAAMFTCSDYSAGMTGAQIIDAFDNLYANDEVKVCGSSYLSNGCHVTVNGCNDCKASVPSVCPYY